MSDWTSVLLGEVLHVKHGFAFPGSGFGGDVSSPQVLTPGNFSIGGGFRKSKPKSFAGNYPAEYALSAGDLIVSMTDLSKAGDTLGLPARIPEGSLYLHNQRIGLVEITAAGRVSAAFLNYYLRTGQYRNYILGTASGSTVRHTSPSRIHSYVAKLPPLSEQSAIAEVLGVFDRKIAINAEVASTASTFARLVFDHAIQGIELRPMSELLNPILGGTPSRGDLDLWGGTHLWASAKDITGAKSAVVISTEESISDMAIRNTKAKPLPVGSVILTARGTVGAVARLAAPASFNQSCYGFVPGKVPSSILYLGILNAMKRAKEIAHGSVFDTITMRTFDHLDFPVFDRDASKALDRRIAPLLDAVTAKVKENETLAELRDTLLPELMSGRLQVGAVESVVTDAL